MAASLLSIWQCKENTACFRPLLSLLLLNSQQMVGSPGEDSAVSYRER
jgi:hypothetical protein